MKVVSVPERRLTEIIAHRWHESFEVTVASGFRGTITLTLAPLPLESRLRYRATRRSLVTGGDSNVATQPCHPRCHLGRLRRSPLRGPGTMKRFASFEVPLAELGAPPTHVPAVYYGSVCHARIVSKAPATIRATPSASRHDSGSWRKMAARATVNGRLSLSIGATAETGPSWRARK